MLWAQPALIAISGSAARRASDGAYAFKRDVGAIRFIPLMTANAGTTAEFRVAMLHPGNPEALLTRGGDIDHRLNTVFGALSFPQCGQLPPNVPQPEGPA